MRTCEFPGCSSPVVGWGYCSAHYQQLKRGIPLTEVRHRFKDVLEKFLHYAPDDYLEWERGCAEWSGTRTRGGYGRIKHSGWNHAHVYAYWAHRPGETPDREAVIRHTCDNRLCVTPLHLVIGDRNDNIQDAVKRGRNAKGSMVAGSKLSAEQALAIYSDPRAQETIGKDYGITQGGVWMIKHGKSWAHVTGHGR